MSETSLATMAELAAQLRDDSIRSSTSAGSGHPTSSMSAADLLAVLVTRHLRYDWDDPRSAANDHLIFSKGHASPLLYSVFKAIGVVSDEELMTGYRRFGQRLQGHPTPVLPWVDVATGSLGQGLPDGVGVALAGKYLDRLPYRIWVLCGDSELAEGSIWEALDKASYYRLSNLIAIVDVNRLGQRGPTDLGWNLDAYARVERFGHRVVETDPGVPDRGDDSVRQGEVAEFVAGVLAAAVGVNDGLTLDRPAAFYGHRQRVSDQFGAHVPGHGPADDLPRIAIDDRGEIRPARPCADIGDVGEPQLVGPVRDEAALHEVDQAVVAGVVAHRGGLVGLGMHAVEPGRPGEPADPLGRVPVPELGQLDPDPVDPQPAVVLGVDFLDEHGDFRVLAVPIRLRPRLPRVIPGAGHLKHLADESGWDSVAAWFASFVFLHVLDEGELHRLWLANHAAAFFRISRSILSRRFSSSSS
jgi:transketolase N-terminal domain/subunit